MLTSEDVSKIERDFADGDTGWMGDRASLRALLKDRAELVAENERLRAVVEAAEELRRLCRTDNYEWDGPEIREAVMAVFAALAALDRVRREEE